MRKDNPRMEAQEILEYYFGRSASRVGDIAGSKNGGVNKKRRYYKLRNEKLSFQKYDSDSGGNLTKKKFQK